MTKTKTMFTITFSLILIMAMLITVVPFTSAQDKDPSYAFVNVSPRTAEVNQPILVTSWTSPVPPEAYMGAPTSAVFRTDYIYTFTKPDGNTDTVGPNPSYADGTSFFTYTPDQIGSWSVVLYWPGDELHTGSTSPPFTFAVQTEAVAPWPGADLPNEYWQRPVNAENHEWSQLLADWPMSNYDARNSNFNPYSPAPESAHILWTRVEGIGGIMGSQWGPSSYRVTVSPVVMGGRVYYSPVRGGELKCVDVFTGEEYWSKPILGSLKYVTLDVDPDPGGAATHSEIWTTSGKDILIYDGSTGALKKTYADTGFTISAYHDGYFYSLMGKNWTKWDPYSIGTAGVRGATFEDKIVWSVNITSENPSLYWEDVAVSTYGEAAYDLETGELMWSEDRDTRYMWRAPSVGFGKYCLADVNMQWHGYDIYTGVEEWVSEQSEYPFGAFFAYYSASAYDKAYALSFDGHIYAFDINDGSTVWKFYSGDSKGETPFGTWPFWNNPAIADGKVYAGTTEHTPTQPRTRGNRLYCIDDDTGNEIWSIAGSYAAKAIADGILLASNEYDATLYAFGKGPTETSVSIKNDVIQAGSTVLITGSVTDQSPATKQDKLTVRFPDGVPAVSEDSMSAWMEYLHMQKPISMNTTGVPVTISTIDPNGNYYDIDTITTDTMGFRLDWTPPENEGVYQIIVSFEGTTSYWPSYAETAILVGPAPEPTTEPTQATATQTDTYITGSTIAILAGIAIAVFLILRKK